MFTLGRVNIHVLVVYNCLCVCVCVCAGRGRERAGEEPGDLGVLRIKLLRFLETSQHYAAEQHISSFPPDGERLPCSLGAWVGHRGRG